MTDDFGALPKNLQLQIDAAFDAAVSSLSSTSSLGKRHELSPLSQPEPAGGFIIDDIPGGFIVPSGRTEEIRPSSEDDNIPFSLIPTALQILDLPPEDEEVLQVFRNAASGWSGVVTGDEVHEASAKENGMVNRRDWRAVCAVVIGTGGEDANVSGDPGSEFLLEDELATTSAVDQSTQEDAGEEEEEEEEEDAFEEAASEPSSLSPFSDLGEESDSDEYLSTPSKKRYSKSKVKSKRAQTRFMTSDAPSPRQKRAAFEAYALFFPSSPPLSEEAIKERRLMYKDIMKVANLLKEKIKADEITEMLSLFSTSPDGSVGFEDFTRMMIMAKLA